MSESRQPGRGRPGASRSSSTSSRSPSTRCWARCRRCPLIAPDEFLYGHLARSLADGEGLSFYGVTQQLQTALYVYLLAPSWLLASGESAYELAKLDGGAHGLRRGVPRLDPGAAPDAARPRRHPRRCCPSPARGCSAPRACSPRTSPTRSARRRSSPACSHCASRTAAGAWLAFAFAIAATAARAQMARALPDLPCRDPARGRVRR